jgi:Flp pilus assembly protein TadB
MSILGHRILLRSAQMPKKHNTQYVVVRTRAYAHRCEHDRTKKGIMSNPDEAGMSWTVAAASVGFGEYGVWVWMSEWAWVWVWVWVSVWVCALHVVQAGHG